MALTDENSGGFVATMPMAPAYGGGYGGGFGNGFTFLTASAPRNFPTP